MSGGLATRPITNMEESTQEPAVRKRKGKMPMPNKADYEEKTLMVGDEPLTIRMMKQARDKKMADMPMPSKAPAKGTGEGLGGEAEDNPADYKLMNSPTEGVFLQNPTTGKQLSLQKASQIPGFESLVEEGMLKAEELRRAAFK